MIGYGVHKQGPLELSTTANTTAKSLHVRKYKKKWWGIQIYSVKQKQSFVKGNSNKQKNSGQAVWAQI